MDKRVATLLSQAGISWADSWEDSGITVVLCDFYNQQYIHFDSIKTLSESMLFKGIKIQTDKFMEEVVTLEFITL